jgi:ParB-like chromosome segregation protein Spo0J
MAVVARHSTINIDTITERFFVRKSLNDDHVIHLASLYQGGTKLPPVEITREGELVDGRHRIAALKLLDRKAVDVLYTDETDQSVLLVQAVKSNIGGALPPSNTDIVYAMRQMLEKGMSQVSIQREFVGTWPPAVVRRYVSDAQSALTKERIVRAKAAIVEQNLTITEAAALHHIKAEVLKEAMIPQKKRRSGSAEIKGALSTTFRSRGAAMGAIMKGVMRKYEDGDISAKIVEDIIVHLEKCTKSTVTSAKDWATRLRAVKE